jgi:hypothetical protein
MLEKIIALLTAKFAGVRKDGLALLAKQIDMQVTTEAEAQALIDKLPAEKVTDFVKDYRAEVDKEVSTGVKTNEKTLREKYNFTEKTTPAPPDPTPPAPDLSKGLKAEDLAALIKQNVEAAIKPLQEEITTFKSGKTLETRRASLEEKLKEAPENFKAKILKDFTRMSFNTDDDFNTYLTETEQDLAALTQELADQGLGQQGRPAFAAQTKDGVSKATQSYIDSTKPEGGQFEGKKIGS